MDFDTAFTHVVGIEGGYVNDPDDPGGETKYGITVAVAREYGYTGAMVDLPLDVAKDIYRKKYWDTLQGDRLPFPLAEFLFDFAVNSGEDRAAKVFQCAVGAQPDGVIGPVTLSRLSTSRIRPVLRYIFIERTKVMAHSPILHKEENGWFGRLFDVTMRAADEGI